MNKVACPCCDNPTLTERGVFEVCAVCGWEDDGLPSDLPSCANSGVSLDSARALFAEMLDRLPDVMVEYHIEHDS